MKKVQGKMKNKTEKDKLHENEKSKRQTKVHAA